jgi:hypothetical protein
MLARGSAPLVSGSPVAAECQGALRLGCLPLLDIYQVPLGWVHHYLEADSHRPLLSAELRRIRWVIHSRRG